MPEKAPKEQPLTRYSEGHDLQYAQNDGEGEESSVITEIVDEQIVELNSDDEEKVEDGINQYLDNIKQEDYVNREEYQELDENKDEEFDDRKEDMFDNKYEEEYKNFQKQQLYSNQDKLQQYNQNVHMENSPIYENPNEDELTSSPQYYEAPRV
eukprot:CAMPEP_0168350980 /NCGR_PEP_ID=MMETSP0213-20121227/21512_1 /TAXON_ID=151035 /ORGANISM="Euplotes harpa, Strain FSP1.4" /LENGTH=153 /DNA_ID=CAMNT_0008361571 /DNA_START=143 /DNA_END=601 /DNA_ORIENTATION=-